MLVQIAILALAGQSPDVDATPRPVIETRMPLGTIKIPDEIGFAVQPYLMCRFASMGIPVLSKGKEISSSSATNPDCAAVREKAAEDSEKELRRLGGRTNEERAAFITKALSDVDTFTNAIPTVGSVVPDQSETNAPDN